MRAKYPQLAWTLHPIIIKAAGCPPMTRAMMLRRRSLLKVAYVSALD